MRINRSKRFSKILQRNLRLVDLDRIIISKILNLSDQPQKSLQNFCKTIKKWKFAKLSTTIKVVFCTNSTVMTRGDIIIRGKNWWNQPVSNSFHIPRKDSCNSRGERSHVIINQKHRIFLTMNSIESHKSFQHNHFWPN